MYLTRRQREMLDCIERFIRTHGYSPTLDEIGRAMGLSSLATVHKHLQNLETKGLIRRNWNHSRAIEVTGRGSRRFQVTARGGGYEDVPGRLRARLGGGDSAAAGGTV